MRHAPLTPQFFVTAPQPCPYLKGKMERKLFTALDGDDSTNINDNLSRQGFRRSQNVVYRPSCSNCAACMSARVVAAEFKPSRSQKRVLKRNKDLVRRPATSWATDVQYDLFSRYLDSRHADGGMAEMDMYEFGAMVEETPVRSRMVEYYRPTESGHELIATCLTDMLDDGLSMVYSFFDPEAEARSLGTFMILDHINLCLEMGYEFVYLGYWVPGSPKMAYKAKFPPLQIHMGNEWHMMNPDHDYDAAARGVELDPIAMQVQQISINQD